MLSSSLAPYSAALPLPIRRRWRQHHLYCACLWLAEHLNMESQQHSSLSQPSCQRIRRPSHLPWFQARKCAACGVSQNDWRLAWAGISQYSNWCTCLQQKWWRIMERHWCCIQSNGRLLQWNVDYFRATRATACGSQQPRRTCFPCFWSDVLFAAHTPDVHHSPTDRLRIKSERWWISLLCPYAVVWLYSILPRLVHTLNWNMCAAIPSWNGNGCARWNDRLKSKYDAKLNICILEWFVIRVAYWVLFIER